MSKGPSILFCVCGLVGTLCGEEYLSNLANPWIDPGNPTCHCSIGDIHTLLSEYEPFALQFFTGSASDQNYAKMRIGNPGSGATNSTVKSFELNAVTFEFIWGHLQAWSNVNVQLYSQVRKDRVLVGEFGNPTINPGPTQWPESVNPGFCTTYVDYHPLNQILLQPSTQYWLELTAASDNPPNFGLLFSLSSKFVTSTDWRMGETMTRDPWAAGEYLKCAIGATAIIGTNAPPSAVSDVTLSAKRVGNKIVLSWPTSTAPVQLYSATSFESATWRAVSAQPVILNDNFVVTLTSSGSGGYFRLQGK